MKAKIFRSLPLVLCLLCSSGAHAAGTALSFEELFQKALGASEKVGIASLQKDRQALQTQQLESQESTRLTFKAGADLAARRRDSQATTQGFEPDASLELRHPLYDGGQLSAKKAKAEALTKAADHELSQEQLSLKLSLNKAFYELLAAETDVRNLTASRKLYEKRIATLKERQKIGRSKSSEVLAAQTQLQVLIAQSAVAEAALHQAELKLSHLSGLEAPFSLIDSLHLDTIRQASPTNETPPSPSLAAAKARTEAAEQEMTSQKANTKPKLDAIAAYNWSRSDDIQQQKLSAGLGLTWTLYDAGESTAMVSGANLEMQKAALQEKELLRQVGLEFQLAQKSWTEGLLQVTSLEQAYEIATQTVRVQQQDYDNGLVTNLELMQAMDTQLQVKRNLDQAVYRCKQAYLETQLRKS